nr:MetaGeneMark_Unknown Function [uncultured bacterium]
MRGTISALAAYHPMAEDFSERCEQALQRFMAEFGITERDKAMRHIVQDWLISHGYAETLEGNAQRPEGDGGRDPEFVQYPSYYKDGGTL